jgi:hypothetical protein
MIKAEPKGSARGPAAKPRPAGEMLKLGPSGTLVPYDIIYDLTLSFTVYDIICDIILL